MFAALNCPLAASEIRLLRSTYKEVIIGSVYSIVVTCTSIFLTYSYNHISRKTYKIPNNKKSQLSSITIFQAEFLYE